MKIKKISLTSLSNREMDRKEKAILSGGQGYCGCATVCLANCGCTYIELYTAQDFMGQAAHMATYDAAEGNPSADRIDKTTNNVYM